MTNNEVCKRFAEGATKGHNSTHSIYIDGDTIFSYGPHFPMAERTGKEYNGRPVALFTTNGYSMTTSHHKSDCIMALFSKYEVVRVDLNHSNPEDWARQLREDIAELGKQVQRARKDYTRAARLEELKMRRQELKVIKNIYSL